jgi:NADPH:quinone reductase-like Zn-dependent oxidoreductase
VPLDGKTVVVNGAAGGVGHFAVQIAKWKGARVIAVASGKHEAFVPDPGANEFIDYTVTPPEDVSMTPISSSTRSVARVRVASCIRSSVAALCS